MSKENMYMVGDGMYLIGFLKDFNKRPCGNYKNLVLSIKIGEYADDNNKTRDFVVNIEARDSLYDAAYDFAKTNLHKRICARVFIKTGHPIDFIHYYINGKNDLISL